MSSLQCHRHALAKFSRTASNPFSQLRLSRTDLYCVVDDSKYLRNTIKLALAFEVAKLYVSHPKFLESCSSFRQPRPLLHTQTCAALSSSSTASRFFSLPSGLRLDSFEVVRRKTPHHSPPPLFLKPALALLDPLQCLSVRLISSSLSCQSYQRCRRQIERLVSIPRNSITPKLLSLTRLTIPYLY